MPKIEPGSDPSDPSIAVLHRLEAKIDGLAAVLLAMSDILPYGRGRKLLKDAMQRAGFNVN